MSERIIERQTDEKKETRIDNDNLWTTLSVLRWKYIADISAVLIIGWGLVTYSLIDKSLPQWFQLIVIMASFWVFFPSLYAEYMQVKNS